MQPLRLEGLPGFPHPMGVKLLRGRASIPVWHPFPQPQHGLDVLLDHRNPVGSWRDWPQSKAWDRGCDIPTLCTLEHSGLSVVTLTWSAGLPIGLQDNARCFVPIDEDQLCLTICLILPVALLLFHGCL